MRKKYFHLISIAAVLMLLTIAGPASAAVFEDEEAGFKIEYDDETWFVEDMEMMFGDLTEFDADLISEPFVITNYDEEVAAIMIVVSGRDDYKKDVVAFIEHAMGKLTRNDIYKSDDTFTDSSGDEFESKVRVWGVAPKFEDEGILMSQIFMAGDKRYEICFLALHDNFMSAWKQAIDIINSIDIEAD